MLKTFPANNQKRLGSGSIYPTNLSRALNKNFFHCLTKFGSHQSPWPNTNKNFLGIRLKINSRLFQTPRPAFPVSLPILCKEARNESSTREHSTPNEEWDSSSRRFSKWATVLN